MDKTAGKVTKILHFQDAQRHGEYGLLSLRLCWGPSLPLSLSAPEHE